MCGHQGGLSGQASGASRAGGTGLPVSSSSGVTLAYGTFGFGTIEKGPVVLAMSAVTRLKALDWPGIELALSEQGYARTPQILTPDDCQGLIGLYSDGTRFRKHIDMARHRLGVGDYKYFAPPLPPIVQELRRHAYPPLAAIANRWMEALGSPHRYAPTLDAFHQHCAERGQTQLTPLLLHYTAGGYNCLHQDLYGEVAFPLQITGFLSRPEIDYSGGEFLLVQQRPRAQSVGEAILPNQGELVIFATRERPVRGKRGFYRVSMRHGISRVRAGTRYTLGVIFHNAR